MEWQCGAWSDCVNGFQTRECNFVKVPQHVQETECPDATKPPLTTQSCIANIPPATGLVTASESEAQTKSTSLQNESSTLAPEKPSERGLGAITGAAIKRIFSNPKAVMEIRLSSWILLPITLAVIGYFLVFRMGGPSFLARRVPRIGKFKMQYHQRRGDKLLKKGHRDKAEKHYKKAEEFKKYLEK